MTSTLSWTPLPKPRQSMTIVKLPVNTAFQNPGEKKAQPATFSVSWWAADDNKLYIHPKGLRWISCYRALAVKHVCKCTFVCFSIEVFWKQYSFLTHRNKGLNLTQSSLHLRPKSSAFSPFSINNKCSFFPFLTVSSAKIAILRFCCAKILGYKTHPNFNTNFTTEDRIFLKKLCALQSRNYVIDFRRPPFVWTLE